MKDPVRSICQEMWDIGLRVSPATRTLDDCAHFDQDNVEFTISLLDCRFLTGEAALFERLRGKLLPQLVARESDVLVQRLTEVTRRAICASATPSSISSPISRTAREDCAIRTWRSG